MSRSRTPTRKKRKQIFDRCKKSKKELNQTIADLTTQLKSAQNINDETITGLATQVNDLQINNHDVSESYEDTISGLIGELIALRSKNRTLIDTLAANQQSYEDTGLIGELETLRSKNKLLRDTLAATQLSMEKLQNRDLASSPSATDPGITNSPIRNSTLRI